jgi:hypothetical protein
MGALKVWDGTTWLTASQQGPAGTGLPPGGATNALLAKQSAADSDAVWTTGPVVASITAGTATITVSLNLSDGANFVTGTATGTKFGTTASQKLGWWGANPTIQSTGWSISGGYTPLKAWDPNTATLAGLARVVATLQDTLKSYGQLG